MFGNSEGEEEEVVVVREKVRLGSIIGGVNKFYVSTLSEQLIKRFM